MIALDTETYLIGPKALAPKLVCASFRRHDNANSFVKSTSDNLFWQHLHGALGTEIVGANIAYDLAVICTAYPDLLPLVFKALDEGRVHDVQIRERLINLARHGEIKFGPTNQPLSYSLAWIAKKRVGLDLFAGKDGPDIWRLRYHELDGLPASEYPKEAYDYAALDAQATYEVWADQENQKQFLKSEPIHVRAAFDLYLKSAYGLMVDKEQKAETQAAVEAELGPDNLPLLYAGENPILWRATPPVPYARDVRNHYPACRREKKKGQDCDCPPRMTKGTSEKLNKKAALIPLIESVCEKHGIPIKQTEKGATAADSEFIKELAPLDPTLKEYQKRQSLIKLQTSYFPGFEWPPGSGITADVIHPRYDVLKKTGRTSSYGNTKKTKEPLYPAVNIQQADPRIRRCYMPRPGWIYAVADYTALELCSCAQTMLNLFGKSHHAEQINAGIDCHAFLGSVLAYNEDPKFRDEVHGLSEEEGYRAFLKKKETDPKWFKHWRTFAKPVGLGFPGGMGLATMVGVCAGYDIAITKHDAKRLKFIWASIYPIVANNYLRGWVEKQGGVYTSPGGMVRSNCKYTELANGNALQTPGAEGMKAASWLVTRACYDPTQDNVLLGCRPVINIHDELVVEIPDDEWATERADELSRLMCLGMSRALPDIKISAEPVLTRRWVKSAKSERANGRLTIYEG